MIPPALSDQALDQGPPSYPQILDSFFQAEGLDLDSLRVACDQILSQAGEPLKGLPIAIDELESLHSGIVHVRDALYEELITEFEKRYSLVEATKKAIELSKSEFHSLELIVSHDGFQAILDSNLATEDDFQQALADRYKINLKYCKLHKIIDGKFFIVLKNGTLELSVDQVDYFFPKRMNRVDTCPPQKITLFLNSFGIHKLEADFVIGAGSTKSLVNGSYPVTFEDASYSFQDGFMVIRRTGCPDLRLRKHLLFEIHAEDGSIWQNVEALEPVSAGASGSWGNLRIT